MNPKNLKKTNIPLRAPLPPAAKRWLDHALPENFVAPSQIQIRQEGTMDIRGQWTPFRAEGIYEKSPLSFTWKTRFRMLPAIWIIADDGHATGEGWGSAQLWRVLPMGKRTDPEVLAVQLIRNIGELALHPEFALPARSLVGATLAKTLLKSEVMLESGRLWLVSM